MAWLRRLIVSVGVGGASYVLMLGILVLSVVYDREFEPVITFAFDKGRKIIDTLDSLVAGSYWGQVAVNHASGDTIPGARKLTNVAKQGFSGHHFVIMALCSMIAAFLVNALFAFATSARPTKPDAIHGF